MYTRRSIWIHVKNSRITWNKGRKKMKAKFWEIKITKILFFALISKTLDISEFQNSGKLKDHVKSSLIDIEPEGLWNKMRGIIRKKKSKEKKKARWITSDETVNILKDWERKKQSKNWHWIGILNAASLKLVCRLKRTRIKVVAKYWRH